MQAQPAPCENDVSRTAARWSRGSLDMGISSHRIHEATVDALLSITGQPELLDGNPLLKRSIRNRFPYLDPLNHVQVELLRRHRDGDDDERVRRGIHLSINGIAAGLRNSG